MATDWDSCQWYKDGKALEGETDPTFTKKNATASDAGKYWIAYKNVVGETKSSEVTVTVSAAVPDFTVSTSSVDPIEMGTTKTITATMEPVVEGAKCVWEVVDLDDPADEGYLTITPNPDNQFEATLTPVKVGGGRVQATVTAGGKSAKDSSRASVKEAAPKAE